MLKEYKVNLHVLETCNFRCFHCFSRFGLNKIMGLEHWKQIVDNCIESQVVSEFNIAGGEPLLYKDLRYQAGILGHSMTEMKAFFTSDFNTLKIRSMVLRLAFRISVKKVVHCSVISYKYHVEDV